MSMRKVFCLNGPNLDRLGSREPDVYGSMNLATLKEQTVSLGRDLGQDVDFRQTNSEAELISWLHEAIDAGADVVLNPAAFTHYSYAIRDAAVLVPKAGLKLIEVHISNPHTREQFRHNSVISEIATGVIAGFGSQSYSLALRALASA
jgi:3-dehydroquinate dehydratase-2